MGKNTQTFLFSTEIPTALKRYGLKYVKLKIFKGDYESNVYV